MADKQGSPFKRGAKFVVLPVEAVRANNIRSDDEVTQAQSQVDDEMLNALEEMINAAKAGRLENEALTQGAVAW